MRKKRKNIELTGKKFHQLLVIKENGRTRKGQIHWECLCDCGRLCNVTSSNLTKGYVKSCSCRAIKYKKIEMGDRYFYQYYKSLAKKRLIEFKLTYDEFTEKTRKVCHYCGSMPKDRKLYKNIIKVNGLDRVDSNLGYIKENVVASCFTCNRAKSDMKQEDFYNWIDNLIKFRNGW